jgi:hypothetical protein
MFCFTENCSSLFLKDYKDIYGTDFVFASAMTEETDRYHYWYSSKEARKKDLIPYSDLSGKRGKILGIERNGEGASFVSFILENNSIGYAPFPASLSNKPLSSALKFAVTSDTLDRIKREYLGTTVYTRIYPDTKRRDRLFHEHGDSVLLLNCEPLKVRDVQPVYLPDDGTGCIIYFMAEDSLGEKGYYPCDSSYFYDTNPFQKGWSRTVVHAIQHGEILNGMTKEQLKMSWGDPASSKKQSTNEGVAEQWIYDWSIVYLLNGIIIAST